MTKRILFFFLLISSLFPLLALAQDEIPAADLSELRLSGTVEVRQIVSPTALQLKDGRFVTLVGLDLPDDNAYEPGMHAVAARDALREAFEGKKVQFYQTKDRDRGRSNRMGHELGHIVRSEDSLWAQGLLIDRGLARVRTSPRNPEMAAQMYSLEAQARSAGTGLWSEGRYAILTPESALQARSGFQIVEGTVHSVAIVRNRIFLNFGPDWKTDFTVAIDAGNRRSFTKAGLDPIQWNGQVLRVRGWLDEWNGPYIVADHPGQFEFPGGSPPPVPEAGAP